MRHAILGAGGVGGLLAAALAKMGDEVTLVLRPEAQKDYPPELSLESPLGSFAFLVKRTTEVSQPFDVLWVTVKATQLESALRVVGITDQLGAVVPLLNGIDHVELLRSRFGHSRVVPGTIGVESERVGPGRIVHRTPSARLVLSAIGEPRLATTLEKLRRFGFSCQFATDEAKMLWTKLVVLASFALTATASGLNRGELAARPEWETRVADCLREACAISAASGTPLDAGPLLEILRQLPPASRPSMYRDLVAGNPLEVDAIAGPLLRGAARHGLAASGIRGLVEMIQAKVADRGPGLAG